MGGCRQLAPDKQWGCLARWIVLPPSAVLTLPTLPSPWSSPSTSSSTRCLFPPRALRLPHSWSPDTGRGDQQQQLPAGKQKSILFTFYSTAANVTNERLLHATIDFLSFLAFSFPLCYKPTYATGLKPDCKQLEQRLSHLVCTRPTTMEPLSCLQTFSNAIIQILLIMIVDVE